MQIILKIILAPFEIGIGAFPGIQAGFGNWLKGLIANLAVFPISILFMVIVNSIIESTQSGSPIWAPSLIAGGDLDRNPILYLVSGGFVPVAIGIGAVMILSKLPDLIPQAIFAIKPSPFGSAIGENLQGPAGLLKTGVTTGAFQGADSALDFYKDTGKSAMADRINTGLRKVGSSKKITEKKAGKLAGVLQRGLRGMGKSQGQNY